VQRHCCGCTALAEIRDPVTSATKLAGSTQPDQTGSKHIVSKSGTCHCASWTHIPVPHSQSGRDAGD
jgi:hypothetical protein